MGFVKAIRGREGGFLLAKDPKDVSVFEIVSSIDGIGDKEVCSLLFEECSESDPCPIHPFIHDLKKEFKARLKKTTLHDMAFNTESF
jgi:Rrf2 family protein